SQLTISPLNLSASASESAVFPLAVGPSNTTNRGSLAVDGRVTTATSLGETTRPSYRGEDAPAPARRSVLPAPAGPQAVAAAVANRGISVDRAHPPWTYSIIAMPLLAVFGNVVVKAEAQ